MRLLRLSEKTESVAKITGSFGVLKGTLTKKDNTASCEGALAFTVKDEGYEEGVQLRTGTLTAKDPLTLDEIAWVFEEDGGEYEVYTQYNGWQNESMGAWQPLQTGVVAESTSARSCSGAAPFVALWNQQTGRGRAFHLLVGGAWQIKVSHYYKGGECAGVRVTLGHHPSHFHLPLDAGETIEMPRVLTYEIENKLDMDAYKMHRYFHKTHAPRKLPVIYNSWLACYDAVNLEFLQGQIRRAAELGAEYFVVDAGWFGRGDTWWECVGDWEENKTARLLGQMDKVADAARKAGMKFGFWLETERAHATSKTFAAHPEWFVQAGENCMLDFANSAARAHITETVVALVKKYGAEFLKMDFNVDFFEDTAHTGFFRYAQGYRTFIESLRQEFPGIYIQGCASGGLRMSLQDAESFDAFWPSDCMSPITGMRIYKDTLRRLPPVLFEKWATIATQKDPFPVYYGNEGEKIFASHDATWNEVVGVHPCYLEGFLTGGPIGFSCDVTQIEGAAWERLKTQIAAFKKDRAYWQGAECRILCDTERVTVLQYSDREMQDVRIQVFCERRLQEKLTVYPKVPENAVYKLGDEEITGRKLWEDGISVSLPGSHRMVSLGLFRKA